MMLILSRRPSEKIILDTKDGLVEVVLHQIGSGQVKIGVNAPQSVRVLREELLPENAAG